MSRVQELKQRMIDLGISPTKALGQNFLISATIIDKIITEVIELQPSSIIEVGPGLGALTDKLISLNVDLKLIELDDALAEYWQRRQQKVIHEDALRVDWEALNLPAGSVLVSNLPYQISSSIVIDRCRGPEGLSAMVLMFQKEVGQRIKAQVGGRDYGLLSVMAQIFWNIDKVADAGPKDFYPAPKVVSRILRFSRKPAPEIEPHEFLKFVKAAFSQRRKYMTKGLAPYLNSRKIANEKLLEALEDLGCSSKVRAEEVKPETFVRLYKRLEL